MKKQVFFLIMLISALSSWAIDPMATNYTFDQCQGSLTPYPTPEALIQIPDSLHAIFINHVGRHGARYPASSANCLILQRSLQKADSIGSITPLGRKLLKVVNHTIEVSTGRWGALDSLGEAEQRGIASRMFKSFPTLFNNAKVNAISSYSPRCMMSMYAFTHQLDRLDNHIEFTTSTGRQYSWLLRPFDIDQDYLDFRKSPELTNAYEDFFNMACPTQGIENVLGKNYPYQDDMEKLNLAITEYYVLAGLSAMSMPNVMSDYLTQSECNQLWSCFNLRQYLQRTANTLSTIPAEIASPLLLELISTTQHAVDGTMPDKALLRFGHAETLMPLLSLMRLTGCYYLTNYYDTVAMHWRDFDVVPMAANLQIILFKSVTNQYYVRIDLNERPIPLLPNCDDIYVSWDKAKEYLERCVPIYNQPF